MNPVVRMVSLLILICTPSAHGHMLNMTEMNLRVSAQGASQLYVRIDLGQSLMSPEQYWRAVSISDRQDQQAALRQVTQLLANGIRVSIGDEIAPLSLGSWQLDAVSLEAIRNPLTPQMATLIFDVPAAPGAVAEVRVDESLQIPWPALLRVDMPDAEVPLSRLLTNEMRTSRPFELSERAQLVDAPLSVRLASTFQAWAPGLTWVAVGFQHIIPRGLDHIVFVLGLFFLAPRMSALLSQVSCFTLAHSLTLGLAILGYIRANANLIEPLIAASIIYVAVDNIYNTKLGNWRLAVVTLFGLLHGLGFASALTQFNLPGENFLGSLLMFNLGVEIGQLTALAIALLAVGWLRNWAHYSRRIARPASLTIAGVGAYWFLKRLALQLV